MHEGRRTAGASPGPTSRVRALWRGRAEDPAWVRPALVGLLAMTTVLYLWDLGASGWANSYYSAAVQAGTRSWKAFLFGSFDASSFITVDKAPAALWPMEISARLFGVSSWSILVPQALEGVATVGVLYATVRRWFTPAAGLVAGAVAALTPVAALMFRFNNPDALLVLLLTLGAYAMTRALEHGRTGWLLATGACVGVAFLAKELQAFLVLPAFGLTYLLCGPPRLRRRIVQLIGLCAGALVSMGWWVALVELWPASSRPYIGGSRRNSFLDVLFGYNGLGRLTGNETGSVGGGAQGTASRWGPTGWARMFNSAFGGQASWLLPVALVATVAGLAFTWRRPRTDRTRAAFLLWGATLFVTAVVFSLAQGIIHEYYTVALAPPIGALVGMGASTLWAHRRRAVARVLFALGLALTAIWASSLLGRTPNWNPWLRPLVLVLGCGLAFVIVVTPVLRTRAALAFGTATLIVGLAGPAAYTLSTVSSPELGAIPVAGPATAGRSAIGGQGAASLAAFARRAGSLTGLPPAGIPPSGGAGPNGAVPGSGFPTRGLPDGGFPGRAGLVPFLRPGGTGTGGPGALAGGRAGGLLAASASGPALTRLLVRGSGDYRWAAAAVGANSAAGYQLASGEPIMAIGGFNGTDPTPTLAEFQRYVRNGDVHYFIAGGGLGAGATRAAIEAIGGALASGDLGGPGGGPGLGAGASTSNEIRAWVTATFTSRTVDGATIYDLRSPAG